MIVLGCEQYERKNLLASWSTKSRLCHSSSVALLGFSMTRCLIAGRWCSGFGTNHSKLMFVKQGEFRFQAKTLCCHGFHHDSITSVWMELFDVSPYFWGLNFSELAHSYHARIAAFRANSSAAIHFHKSHSGTNLIFHFASFEPQIRDVNKAFRIVLTRLPRFPGL
jgi:hypothetical protein